MLVKAYKYSIGRTVDEVMNNCIDGRNQKSKPGPESELFQHVSITERTGYVHAVSGLSCEFAGSNDQDYKNKTV